MLYSQICLREVLELMTKSEFAPFGLCVPLSLSETQRMIPICCKGSQDAAPVPWLCLVNHKCTHLYICCKMSERHWPLQLQLMRTGSTCRHCSLLCNLSTARFILSCFIVMWLPPGSGMWAIKD